MLWTSKKKVQNLEKRVKELEDKMIALSVHLKVSYARPYTRSGQYYKMPGCDHVI